MSAAEKQAPPKQAPAKQVPAAVPVPVLVAGAMIIVVATVGFFWNRVIQRRPPSVPVLTREAAAYLPNLDLSEVDMKAAENYLKQTATTITGKITNKGERALRLVEINCVFHSYTGQVILREPKAIVGRRTGPVAPGQTRAFELTFDNIPQGWNQQLPDLVISQIQFE